MTRDQFKKGYCERSGITEETFDQSQIVLACACLDEGCPGWAAVSNTPANIQAHMELYAPQHEWSGWPGAFCLLCGSEDPFENALALNWFDPTTGKFDTKEHEREVHLAMKCQGFRG